MRTFGYYGGKGMHLKWILPELPLTHTYVEPFCGSASVFMSKPLSESNIINDRDGRIVTLFRVLRNDPEALFDRLWLTPNARDEFVSFDFTGDDVEVARQTLACVLMHRNHIVGHNEPCRSWNWRKWFRGGGAIRFGHVVEKLPAIVDRLQHAQIENEDALYLIEKCNGKADMDCLLYVDPPYHHSSRPMHNTTTYAYEMDDGQHRELLERLVASPHKVALSGYHCELYDELLADWRLVERRVHTPTTAARGGNDRSQSEKRLECLWCNYPEVGPDGRCSTNATLRLSF